MNSALVLTVLVALIPTARSDICQSVTCEKVTKANCEGKIVKKDDLFRCCDVCYRILREGDQCIGLDWTMFENTECAEGLYCDYESRPLRVCRQISWNLPQVPRPS